VRGNLPEGALGATLSGSGPTVIVWARAEAAAAVENALASSFNDATVLRFAIAATGASAV
jgi:homoserine kinase